MGADWGLWGVRAPCGGGGRAQVVGGGGNWVAEVGGGEVGRCAKMWGDGPMQGVAPAGISGSAGRPHASQHVMPNFFSEDEKKTRGDKSLTYVLRCNISCTHVYFSKSHPQIHQLSPHSTIITD